VRITRLELFWVKILTHDPQQKEKIATKSLLYLNHLEINILDGKT